MSVYLVTNVYSNEIGKLGA